LPWFVCSLWARPPGVDSPPSFLPAFLPSLLFSSLSLSPFLPPIRSIISIPFCFPPLSSVSASPAALFAFPRWPSHPAATPGSSRKCHLCLPPSFFHPLTLPWTWPLFSSFPRLALILRPAAQPPLGYPRHLFTRSSPHLDIPSLHL